MDDSKDYLVRRKYKADPSQSWMSDNQATTAGFATRRSAPFRILHR
jgi:hypothetical protein